MTGKIAPEAILVLGMHRSGTSATAGALAALGLHLGDHLVPAAADNPLGYFENADAVSVSEELLAGLDRSWDDVRPLPRDWLDSSAASDAVKAIRASVLPALREQRPWALKDPRMCRLLPLWRPLLAEEKVRTACVLVLRHPQEVAASLQARDGMPAEQAHLLWLRHVFESIAASAKLPRVLLAYERLLADPVAALRDVSNALDIQFKHAPEASVLDAFVDAQARHHSGLHPGAKASDWSALAARVYEALLERADPWAQVDGLNRDFEALCDKHAEMIDVLGAAIFGAERRRRTLQRGLQQQLKLTERALSDAEQLSVQRMEESQALRSALDLTDGLALRHHGEVTELTGRLDSISAALATAEELAFRRQAELEALAGSLDATAAALAAAEALAFKRQTESEALAGNLNATAAALAAAEALAFERLAESQALGGNLNATAAALATAEQLAVGRLAELQATHQQLTDKVAAIEQAQQLALQRQQELHVLGVERAEMARRLDWIESSRVWRTWSWIAGRLLHLRNGPP